MSTTTASTVPRQGNGETEFVLRLLKAIDAEARRGGNITFRVAGWLLRIQILQQFEDQFMLEGPVLPEHLRAHRSLLSALMGYGELLAEETRELGGLDAARHGVSQAALDAALAMLHDKYACWHTPMEKAESESVIAEVFGAGA